MKRPKKGIRSLLSLIVVALLFQLAGFPSIYAADTDQKIDAVMTVDVSTSMNDSDKNKVANEAMKMFVDMASVQGDKIGVVAYTDQIVREKALLKINAAQDKQDVKTFIDQLVRGAYTDLAVGLEEAVKVLDSGKEPGHIPMIVLLADGNNSLNAGRTQEQSDQKLQEAVSKAKSEGIPIYTIGLNADGQLNKDVLENISKETGGKLFVTSTADTLPQILSEIFASHLKLKVLQLADVVANGDFQDVSVPVTNANVLEANISIMSGHPVETKLFDPSGKEIPAPSDNVVLSKSNAYTLIKILKPVQGDWKLKVKGADKDKIDINLVFNYDLKLTMDPIPNKKYNPGDSVDIHVKLDSNGKAVTDAVLYKDMKATLVVTDLDTNKKTEIPLNNTGQEFAGNFKLPGNHDYQLVARAEAVSFSRETQPVTVSAKTAAASTPVPGAPAQAKPAAAQPAKPFPWLSAILGLLGVIILLAAILYFLAMRKKANKGFYGQMVIEVRDEDTGERLNPQYKKLNGFKGKFKLHQLLQLAPEFAETDQIVFTPGKGDTVIITNRSSCIIEKGGRAIDASQGKELRNNDRMKITLQKVNKSVLLDYII